MTTLTLSRYLQQKLDLPGVTPELCELIRQTCDACHRISDAIGKGALAGVLGQAGSENIQGEEQKKQGNKPHRVNHALSELRV